MNFMPFGQLKSFLKILIEVQYKTAPRAWWAVVKQWMERIDTDTLHFCANMQVQALGSPSGRAVTAGDWEGLAALCTLSVFASLGHLSQKERQGALTVSLFSTEKGVYYSMIH